MNKQDINVNKHHWSLLKQYDIMSMKSYTIAFLFCLLIIPNLYSQNYYVSTNANGTGNGTISNPWTIYQAAANAKAGDTVFIDKGTYALTSVLNFSQSGTFSNPIVFRGVRVNEDEKIADGTNNTFLRQDNSSTGGQISISGDYVTLENMIIRQQYPKYVLTVNASANKFTLDSVVVQYPSNVADGSNHTMLTSADSTTIRYCYFWQGPRTIIWVRNSNGSHCKGFLMEYTTISNYDNHYAIQCMPETRIGGDPADYRLEDGVIRNCIFRDSGYESAIYLRNVHNYRVYNNVFINPISSLGNQYGMINFLANDGIISAPAYDAASIFAYNTMYQINDVGSGQIVLHAYTNMNGWTFKNNLVYTISGATIYAGVSYLSTTPAMQNCDIDYNFYYFSSSSVSTKNVIWSGINSTESTTYSWANWKSQRGFDTHTIIDMVPTFANLNSENFRPLSSSSPQVGKGTSLSSWGITTDYDGKPRDPNNPTIGAFEYSDGGTIVDIISPTLLTATVINSTTIELGFSESLESASALNKLNYTINNGIVVNSVSLSSDSKKVTLSTTQNAANQTYTVVVNNVKDLAGNIISSSNNSAQYSYVGDTTPPNLLSAAVINSTTIALLFSEPLETTSAQTKTNYSINNGIVVNSAVLSVDKKAVTLNTTQHTTNQNYTVTASNVKDLAGNIISANNSAQYTFVDNTVGDLKANVKIYLQGPFLSNNMMTELSGNEFLPASQPYNAAPWFYNGTEVLGSGSSSSTDWVLVELRSAQDPALVISRRACLLRNDGIIIEPNGTPGVTFKNLLYGSYYIAVFHRSHLAVMTSVPVSFSPDNSLYDFTNALTKAYGQSAMAEITTGIFGMYAGDGDGNGTINDIDRNNIWSNQNGTMGYLNGDFNLDSGVTVKDINDYWNFNEGKVTQVP